MLAGPSNFLALLNSLQMGFRTARHRAAIDRGLARAGRGEDRIRQVRRHPREDARRSFEQASNTIEEARRQEHDHRAQAARRRGAAGERGRPPADRRATRAACFEATMSRRPPPRSARRLSAARDVRARSPDGDSGAFSVAPRFPTRCGARPRHRCRFSRSTTPASSRGCARRSCSSSTRRRSSARAATR